LGYQVYQTIEVDSKIWQLLNLGSQSEPGAKTIEEIRGKITSDYQAT